MTMCCRKAPTISVLLRSALEIAQALALPRKARDHLSQHSTNICSPGTTLKSIKLSCNAASSTANVCDNVWQIAGSAVKGLAKKQQTANSSEVSESSAECGLQAVKHIIKYPLGVCDTFIFFATELSGELEVQKMAAFCMNFEKCHLVLEALHRFAQITQQLVPSL